ncbi:MAG: hypothetical protein JO369_06735 [Paucibacter sp.]|nr:hypothetical protein [Roseateles sp.]
MTLCIGAVAAALWAPTAFAAPDLGAQLPQAPQAKAIGGPADPQPAFVKHLDHGPRADISPALYQKRIAEWRARAANANTSGK